MKIYFVRFAKISKDKKKDEIVKLERTAEFFKEKNIQKIYIKNERRAEKTAEEIMKKLENPSQEKIPEKDNEEEMSKIKNMTKKIKDKQENVIIIASSSFITRFILFVTGLPLEEKKYFGVKNCSVSRVDFNEKNELTNLEINNCSHLLRLSSFDKY